jgi:predicted neuraminidase
MSSDPAMCAPPVISRPGPSYAPSSRLWQGIPAVERSRDGRLWAAWYSGGTGEGPDNFVVLATSGDDGATWTDPVLAVDPPGAVRAFDPALWHDPTGSLWLCWAQSYGKWDGRAGVWAISTRDSSSDTPRWTEPRRLCDGIMMNKPTVLASGAWILPAAIWGRPVGGPGTDSRFCHEPGDRSGAWLVASDDRGSTWTPVGMARVPERVFEEHMFVERRDGSLWTLVRTAYGIGESTSRDGGRSWSAGAPSGLRNANSRFHIRRLASGRILLVHHDPPDAAPGAPPRSHLVAHLSDDDGRTWRGGLMIDERAQVSYPDAVEAPDGLVTLIYDFERHGAREILIATFTEADVEAGRPVSGRARFRLLVSKAAGTRTVSA